MSNMPPGIPLRPPARNPSTTSGLSRSSASSPPPPRRAPPRPSMPSPPPSMRAAQTRPTVDTLSTPSKLRAAAEASGFSSYLGNTAAFASRARNAISSAAATVATSAAAAAASTPSPSEGSSSGSVRQGWTEWARDWGYGRRSAPKGAECIHTLPGWAVKRPRKGGDEDAFDLHVSAVGFCSFVREPQSASRTQRALMGIAKRFAALPPMPMTSSNILGGVLTEPPADDDGKDLDLPEPQARRAAKAADELSQPLCAPSRGNTTEVAFADPAQLSLAHEYLDLRLRPFWSSVLAFRRVSLCLYPVPLHKGQPAPKPDHDLFDQEPLMRTTFTTNAQGHFGQHFVVPWERICTHPNSIPLAFADDPANDRTDWGLVVRAELLAEDGPDRLTPATTADVTPDEPVRRVGTGATSFFSSAETPNRNDGDGEQEMGLMGLGKTSVESSVTIRIERPGGFRVISDLDDTVKHSDILSGPREVFRNVFCRRLEDICVPGMNKLYNEMSAKGLSGLHFVSNSPFELFPIVSDFLHLNRFPQYYSLKLKFYGGRSIVTSLFEPAGDRKRPSIIEILDEFYDSRFILIGDSGEQDLELYTAIARERPKQIAAVFIRDVTSGRADELRRANASVNAQLSSLSLDSESMRSRPRSPSGTAPSSGNVTPLSTRSNSTSDAIDKTVEELQELSAAEEKLFRRAVAWEGRVQRAYTDMPESVRLVFFQDTDEIESLALALVEGKDTSMKPERVAPAREDVAATATASGH